ncbi:Phosphatidylinositol 4-phosphate 5-kinase 1 [Capsicum baccatum]|uniref:Phosphatidylinositol 4-phosphate 5-kinase n=1 Tax=Capsicum baccatum TaxID=33114 RepID=A0A2G2W8H4_CAPBA|nr:Phosphatidylinositol 4-phosphate 5-kinase 1 [Capsicum baccatum]
MEDSGSITEKVFSNGDAYVGTFQGMFPHGKGKYTWSDGSVYDGCWEEGKMTGEGRLVWPSGASYEGEFSGGYLHGFGVFSGSDGSIYRGVWRMNTQHGIGRKQYQNSDVYDGCWKEGVREGSGRYAWSNGNMYIGNWKDGKMFGRGVMKWFDGDLFDGCWLNGLKHGSGCYRFADGSYYFGVWTKGLKDGHGMFYPAGSKHRFLRKCSDRYDEKRKRRLSHNPSTNSESVIPKVKRSISERISYSLLRGSGSISQRTTSQGEDIALGDSSRDMMTCDSSSALSQSSLDDKTEFLETGYSVGKITPVPIREVRQSDFGDQARIKMYFPRKGSQFTPSHHSVDFYWKDYCPMVFRYLRELFKLDAADYMMSICGDDGLRELSSPGKSGSLFYLSRDDRFVIKTLKKSELKALLKMLPDYYKHVKEHDNTLITKVFGVHRISLKRGKKVRFVVMGNMFCTELRIHRRYDLKGSSQGRSTKKDRIDETTTLKDLDLTYEFHMDKLLREALFKQLSLDCRFLESQNIIDYSLLLGLHFRAPENLISLLEPPDSLHKVETNPDRVKGGISQGELSIPPKGLILVTHEPSSVSVTPGPHIRGSTLRAMSVGDQEVDLLLPGTGRLRVQLGVNMPAQANQKVMQDESASVQVELFEVYDVVLYLGIIDILQEYNMKKKLEHTYKSWQFDPMSISAIEPKIYSKRFLSFLEKVFPAEP